MRPSGRGKAAAKARGERFGSSSVAGAQQGRGEGTEVRGESRAPDQGEDVEGSGKNLTLGREKMTAFYLC